MGSSHGLAARPATVERLSHRLTPGEAFDAFARLRHPFFLDSGLGDGRLGRFSFLGAEPVAVLSGKGRSLRLRGEEAEQRWRGNPFDALRALLDQHRVPPGEAPIPFTGGLVGYLAYDLCHFVERLPRTAIDDIGLPDLHFALYDAVAAYEHATGQWYAASLAGEERIGWLDGLLASAPGGKERQGAGSRGMTNDGMTNDESMTNAECRMRDEESTQSRRGLDASSHSSFVIRHSSLDSPASRGPLRLNFTRESYLAAIRRAKDYIAAGDIFQVNLSQRFETDLAVPPAELYRRLRRVNPAPFAAYLSLGPEGAILSSSPERFLEVAGGHVETRPIKGTRPRGATPAEDQRLAAELLASPKDAAELTMIVDLERNDLGRVCDYGSVVVTEHKALEAYASVFHLVSTIEGQLHRGRGLVDLLKAAFPGGSITGAPKVRAMEIIDELEPTQRSVYTGSLGYIGLDGTMDLNIAIRTILVRGGRAFFQVGGGIVADSDPAAEYQETLDKGQRLFHALGRDGGPPG